MRILFPFLAAACAALTSCGGGGGSDSPTPAPPSYWTMDQFQYNNAFLGAPVVKDNVVSIPIQDTGDSSKGAFSGGNISLVFVDSGTGVYNVIPRTQGVLTAPAKSITFYTTVGTLKTSVTQFVGTTGQINVSKDGNGKYHFSTVGTLTVSKSLDVLGGVVGAPSTMNMTMMDVY